MTGLKNKFGFAERRRRMKALGALAPRFQFRFGPQFSSSTDFGLVLPFKRSPAFIGIVAVFLLVFTVPLIGVLGQLGGESDDSLFSLVFLLFSLFWGLGWSVAVVILALLFLLVSFGRETLEVRDKQLLLTVGVPLLRFGASYHADLIRNFKHCSAEQDSGNSWRGEYLSFDFAGDSIAFGSNIQAERAETMLAQLRQHFPQQGEAAPEIPQPAAAASEEQHKPLFTPGKNAAAQPLRLTSISSLALIAANLIPLMGVLVLQWSIGDIMLLFWAESAVIGFYNLVKMFKIAPWSSLFYGPFFVGHYGAFMAVHLLFIYGLFASSFDTQGTDIDTEQLLQDFRVLVPALLAFVVSHGISFVSNFLGRGEYRGKSVSAQMQDPYRRIMVMHVTIILGGFLAMALETALPALLLLIVLKIAADLRGHLHEHKVAD